MENQRCPKCKAEAKKNGKRKTANRGDIQRYECKSCGFRFIENDGFYRMRNNPQKVSCALDLFFRGISTRKVQEHLGAFYPHNASHKSVYKWVVKYSNKISNYTGKLNLNVGQEIQLDEMEYHRRLNRNQRGTDVNWFIDVIDCKTRFMVASEYVGRRENEEIRAVLKQAKSRTQDQIKIVTTDGLQGYYDCIKKSFGYRNLRKNLVIHNQVNASQGEGFNIMVERMHNSLRARTKTFRGFHGSIESANSIMKGLSIYYNFITKHQSIGCCPYELATDLKLSSNNKWLELIKLSKCL